MSGRSRVDLLRKLILPKIRSPVKLKLRFLAKAELCPDHVGWDIDRVPHVNPIVRHPSPAGLLTRRGSHVC